ncbi:hypothetical protein [Gryllotalpicola sp.]|uniref:hypothetical protein n=1 Tax=Gryllotalpicola sp. TaxID=1932787 RepID=UPI00260BE23D|nr:hypothetical protein [Gryllotalpicola sp.]
MVHSDAEGVAERRCGLGAFVVEDPRIRRPGVVAGRAAIRVLRHHDEIGPRFEDVTWIIRLA